MNRLSQVVRRITQGPDGEGHQERSASPETDTVTREEAMRVIDAARGQYQDEHRKRLALAQDVLEVAERVFAAVLSDVGGRPATMREVRRLALAINDASLAERASAWLASRGMVLGPDGGDGAETLARAILARQLETGEASVSWEARGGSRTARVRAAGVILALLDRDGLATPDDLADALLADALVAGDGMSRSTAETVTLHALRALEAGEVPGQVYPRENPSEPPSTAEAS